MAKILVVDDLPANRALVVTLVGHSGHQALEATDGAEALAVVRAERPELVISDILMPTMDGYEFVRQLRNDPELAATQVIFCSAHYHEQEARSLAQACGVTQVLIKPCEPQDILAAIERALSEAPPLPARPLEHAFQTRHLRLMTDKLTGNMAELEAMNRRLAALTDLNLQIASERDPQVLMVNVCDGARHLVGAQYVVLCVVRKDIRACLSCTSGIDAAATGLLDLPVVSHGLLGQVRAERRPRRIAHNPAGDPRAVGLPAGYPALHHALIVPITSLSFSYGWLCLVNKLGAQEFSDEDEKVVAVLGAQVGRIYENGSLYTEVQRHADQLQLEVLERKRVIEELRTSEAGLHRAQVLAKITHVITGRGGVFESWPDTCPQMLGLAPSAMPRSTREWLDLIHPEDRPLFRAHALEAARDLSRRDFIYRMVRADGVLLHLRQVMEPLPVEDGSSDPPRWFNTIQDISEQKHAEEALRESDRRFSDMLDKVEMLSLMLDTEGRVTYCNDYLLRLTGWRREEVVGQSGFSLFLPPDVADVRHVYADMLADRPTAWHYENQIVTRSGERRLVNWHNIMLRSVEGRVTGIAALGEDITERREAERKIKRLNRVYAMLSGINTLIVRVRQRDELFREACRIAVEEGQFKIAWIGRVDRTQMQLVTAAHAGTPPELLTQLQHTLALHEHATPGEALSAQVARTGASAVCDNVRDDPRIPQPGPLLAHGVASLAMLPLVVAHEVVGVLALFAEDVGFFDAAEMKLLVELAGDIGFALDHLDKEDRLSYLAYYDDITGLPNRTLFLERCMQQLRMREGAAGKALPGVALVDISRFRFVNDTLGRQRGDELLKQVAQRLQKAAGESHDIARIGINSFGITVTDARDANGVALAVDHLMRSCFGTPFVLGNTELRMAAKAGVALYPTDGDDAETLLRNAEAALNKAKASADNLLFYTAEMNVRVAETLSTEGRLREALERGQFVLHYQPKQHLASGALAGAEALIRWHDPERGLVPPGQFIPILEETGLIYDVGRWALRQALADNQRWRRAGHPPLRVAVNVSFLQLRHRGFIAEVAGAIAHDPQAAAGLELEITESMVMEDVEHSIRSLHALREMGITIAIDDFGTGFSSLSYLARLPVDTLKIDRSFILGMAAGPQGQALVSTIVNLGHSLGLKVVAEGVEADEQSRQLAMLGCDEIQGYLLSQPLPAEAFEERFLRPAGQE